MEMKVKADIHHSLSTSNTYSSDLDIQWQPLTQLPLPVKVFAYDLQGRFAAAHLATEKVVRVYDTRTVCVPTLVLPVPASLFTDSTCLQLCFSASSHYLMGSFVFQSKKRPHHQHSDVPSKVVLWHLPSQRIVQILK
jgi:hypothetical protein